MDSDALKRNVPSQFACMTFCATRQPGDSCGSDGLPLTPCSIEIYGRAQGLKTLTHPNLCSYVDIIKGKHERCVVVSEFVGELVSVRGYSASKVLEVGYDLLSALAYLHSRRVVHRCLSLDNILVINGRIKLFNYGLYYMTGGGSDVNFRIGEVKYMAPEVLVCGPWAKSNHKVDVWSAGVVLAELFLKTRLWTGVEVKELITRILGMARVEDPLLYLAGEADALDEYLALPKIAVDLVNMLLVFDPRKRPGALDVLESSLMFDIKANFNLKSCAEVTLSKTGLVQLYHFWLLSGGDLYTELKSEGLIRSLPPVLSLPNLLMLEGYVFGTKNDQSCVLDDKMVKLSTSALLGRLAQLPPESKYPLIEYNSELLHNESKGDAANLPLVIREKDTEYQFKRVLLYRRILDASPYKKDVLSKEARQDIPPLVRPEVWAYLLDVNPNHESIYKQVDKESPMPTDRQIEVDIPRCHQYNDLLASSEGHLKFKRVLKAWLASHPTYVYWQGLDSLAAPFLYLNFDHESRAYACLSSFIDKYLHNFFLKDNSVIIKEYLVKFKHLIAFQDPDLANHLHDIGFTPELFAIPWYLTMFSHVFPLHKILHLWDSLLLGNASYPLYVGLAILQQLRPTLLSSGFNECILLFSDLPEIDIERVVKDSVGFYCGTPSSVTHRAHESEQSRKIQSDLDMSAQTLVDIQKHFCPSISGREFLEFLSSPVVRPKLVIVDLREHHQFTQGAVPGSINIPISGVDLTSAAGSNFTHCPETSLLFANKGKIIIVLGETNELTPEFCHMLVRCGFPKVCALHGGIDILRNTQFLTNVPDTFS